MRGSVMGWMAAAALFGMLGACAATPPSDEPMPVEGGLAGTSWTLVEVEGRAAAPGGDGTAPTLAFENTGQARASGNSGCNQFGGSYTHDAPSLEFGPLASTKRACVDEALNRQETAYLNALQSTTRATYTADRLDLYAGDRLVARFRAAAQ